MHQTYPEIRLSGTKQKQAAKAARQIVDDYHKVVAAEGEMTDKDFGEWLVDRSYAVATAVFGDSQYDERQGGGAEKWLTFRELVEHHVCDTLGKLGVV